MRRIPVLSAALLSLAAFAAGRPLPQESERASITWEASKSEVFAGEPVRLRLRIECDDRFLDESAVPLFLRRLDLPVQVEAAWPEGEGIETTTPASAAGPTETFALNGEVAAARRGRDLRRGDRVFRVLVLERDATASSPGTLELPAPTLRCAYATSFREDALGGRVAEDRHEILVEGRPLSVLVKPLPAEGRPADFGGAVGRFTVEAGLEGIGPAGAGPIRIALRIRGEGNLARFEPPRPPGGHLLGLQDDRAAPVRTVTWDLEPEGGAVEVPSIRLPFFDPEEGGWGVAETGPLGIPVAARAPAVREAGPPSGQEEAVGEGTTGVFVFLLLIGIIGFAVLLIRLTAPPSAGAASRGASPESSRAAAVAGFRLRIEDPAADPGPAFASYLAARLGVLPPAVVGPDLRRRLEAAGAPPDLAARTAALMVRLVEARYGGSPVPEGREEARVLVEEWERATLRAREGGHGE